MIEIPLNTSYVLAVGPFVDPVSAISVSTASIADSQAAVLIKHASSIETNIKSFTFSHSSLASGMGFLHLRASILNVVGKVDVVIEYPARHLPFRQTVNIISSGYYNWKYGGTSPASLASGIRSAIATEVWNTVLTGSTAGNRLISTMNLVSTINANGALLSSVVSGVWSAVLSDYTTAGTAGADLKSTLNLASALPKASAIASQVWSYPTAGTKAASNVATQVWQTVGSTTAHQTIVSGVWNHGTRVLTASTNFTIPTAAAIASAVWTFAASGVAFSTIASHVWAQKESVTIAAGGFPVGGYAAGAVTAAAIAADAITSSELASTAAEKIADALLNRDLAGGASGDTRNVRNAFRMLRNRVDASTGTVYAENDSTAAWSFAVSTVAGNPIVAIDPD